MNRSSMRLSGRYIRKLVRRLMVGAPRTAAPRYGETGILIATVFLLSWPALAQKVAPRLTQPIDETMLLTLSGNTRPEANPANDRGAVADQFPLEHMFLQLRRSPAQEQALEEFIDQLHDRNSSKFHQWLTAQEFGERYGLARQDLATITGWLEAHGFTVGGVYPNGMVIDFSGIAGQVREAFHTEIHNLEVNGVKHTANVSDPRIPAALAPAVAGIVSLHDFRPRPMYHPRADYTFGSGDYYVVPADLATLYNFNPIFAAGVTGQGQMIVALEDTDVYSTNDWNTFRTTFGLAAAYPYGSFTQVHPSGCSDPGVNANGDDVEAILDAEWASAAAPNATIQLASCKSTTTFGGFIALQNLLNASGTPPAIVSISYGDSETETGAAANAAINVLYQQAVAEGVSVFVSSGDQLAAASDTGSDATHGINVSGWASTPYNVAVGGTDFGDTYAGANSTYWSATNGATYGSALSYIPEITWNDSCASVLIASYVLNNPSAVTYGTNGFCNSSLAARDGLLNVVGGSGGPSKCATGTPSTNGVVSGTCAGYPKPNWQSVLGNPSDLVRDLPDVSLFAANGFWGHAYVVCYSDPNNGGHSCTSAPSTWWAGGGTSFTAPIMAGTQALINQYTGKTWGNPNPTYYALASTEYGASGSASCYSSNGNGVGSTCIFYDVTQGDIDAPCTGANNCYLPSGTYGVLSTSNSSYLPAYGTNVGWDFATGIGTVNVTNLVKAFASGVQQSQTIIFPNPGTQSFGVAPFGLTATASSGLAVTYAVISGPARVSGSTLTITGAGSVTVQATQAGSSNYYPATPVSVTFAVSPAVLTVTANNATMTYGGALPTFTASYAGFVNGDTQSVLSGSPSLTTTATSASLPGAYVITVAQGTLAAANYTFTFVNGTLTVLALTSNPIPAITRLSPLPVSAGSPAFTLTVTGQNFVANTVAQWNGSPRATTVLNATQLTAAITAADVATVGTANVTVVNPAPGGGTSAAFEFAIDGSLSGGTSASSVSVTAQNANLNVTAGQSVSVPVTFSGTTAAAQITATCANLPAGWTCTYDNSSKTVTIQTSASTSSGTYQVLVIFTVTQQTAVLRQQGVFLASWAGLTGLPLGLVWMGSLRKKGVRLLAAWLVALGLALSLAGCGGGGSSSGPTTPVTTNAQSSLALTLTIQ